VLDDINLSIYPKEFVSIIGSSGSGKTTLLNIISGLEYPTTGRVLINESDFADLNEEERAKFDKKKFALTVISLTIGCEIALGSCVLALGTDSTNRLSQNPDFQI